MAANVSGGTSARAATVWTTPVPSRTSKKWIAPLLRRL
jgi:hypothetical protein